MPLISLFTKTCRLPVIINLDDPVIMRRFYNYNKYFFDSEDKKSIIGLELLKTDVDNVQFNLNLFYNYYNVDFHCHYYFHNNYYYYYK